MYRIVWICIILPLWPLDLLGQQPDWTAEQEMYFQREPMQWADYVFEGTVVHSARFKYHERWLATNTVQIHKVFRGKLVAGTVEVISGWAGTYIDSVTKDTIHYYPSHVTTYDLCHTYLFLFKEDRSIKTGSAFDFTNKKLLGGHAIGYCLRDRLHGGCEYEGYFSAWGIGERRFEFIQDIYDYLLMQPNIKLRDFDHKVFVQQQQK